MQERLVDGYIPVSETSADFQTYLDASNAFQLEVLPVDCDIVDALAGIRDAIDRISIQQAQSALTCCNYEFDPGTYYNPDPAEGDPENKCALAYSYALLWSAGVIEVYHQWSVGAFPALGVLAAILDELGLPGQTLLELVTLGASNALPVLESIFIGNVESLIPNITCAVYSAQSASEARANIYAEIDSIEGLNSVVAQMLKSVVAISTLNKVFDATLPVTTEEIPDCQTTCEEGEGDLFQTALVFPFNRLIVGDSTIEHDDDETLGYQGQNSGIRFELYFTPPEVISEWGWVVETNFSAEGGSAAVTLQHFDGGWFTLEQWVIADIPLATWTDIGVDGIEIELSPATAYRMLFERQEFNLFAWWRKALGSSLLF